jgi:hypothetical protein
MTRKPIITNIVFILLVLAIIQGCTQSPKAFVLGNIQINGSAYSDNFSHYNISLYSSSNTTYPFYLGINITNSSEQINDSVLANIDTTYYNDGSYIVNLSVYDTLNQSSTDLIYIDIDNIRAVIIVSCINIS